MLTGDKRETAVTIAATSTLANPLEDFIDHIDIGALAPTDPRAAQLVGEQLQVVKQHVDAGTKRVSFVIDGPALMLAMEHHKPLFIDISQRVSSAVCCRLTPLQKANVVNMFQTTTGLTALAIGDGANDVSMIQEGRVGVGIVGLEGAQAALAADYAIPRFKHLRRLCAVHGRYALVRNALCILFSFYKNLFLSLTQVYYSFWCGFSGQSLYDGWLLSFFNFAFTSAPPLAIGIVEKDLPERELMRNPKLFADLRTGLYFNLKTIALWFAEGAFHSLVVYFVMYWSLLLTDVQSFRIMSNWTVSTIMMTTLVFLSLVKLSLHVKYWQVVTIASIAFSILFYLLFVLVYSAISLLFGYSVFYAVFFVLLGEPKFWLYSILFLGGLVFPIDMTVMYIQKQFCPDSIDEVEADAVRREAEGTAPV
jgi:phospholipid-transporting ATPase